MKIDNAKRNTLIFSFIWLIILGAIAAVSPSSQKVMIIYIILAVTSVAFYGISIALKTPAYGFTSKGAGLSIGLGLLCLVIFYSATFIEGFSLFSPPLPQSVGSDLQWFVVNIVAPSVETVFFFGAVMGLFLFSKFFRKHLVLTAFFVAIISSLFHLGAYIIGFENLSSFGLAYSVFLQNLIPFIAAFTFFFISGVLLVTVAPNLLFVFVFHLVNIFISFKNAVGSITVT